MHFRHKPIYWIWKQARHTMRLNGKPICVRTHNTEYNKWWSSTHVNLPNDTSNTMFTSCIFIHCCPLINRHQANNSSSYCYWRIYFVSKEFAPLLVAFHHAFLLSGKDGWPEASSGSLYCSDALPHATLASMPRLYVLYRIYVERENFQHKKM